MAPTTGAGEEGQRIRIGLSSPMLGDWMGRKCLVLPRGVLLKQCLKNALQWIFLGYPKLLLMILGCFTFLQLKLVATLYLILTQSTFEHGQAHCLVSEY